MRKEKTIKITDRQRELTFKLREMGALKTEKWKFKAIMLLVKGGVQVPDGANVEQGLQGLLNGGTDALIKTLSSIDEEKAIGLFDEMLFACTEFSVNGVSEALTPELIDATIEDSTSLTKLRWELLQLHFDFLLQGGQSATPAKQHIKMNVASKD